MNNFDVIIIGAGILGLSAAYKIIEKEPALKICLLEKELKIASHQTGHNSGVIHSGIYYKPGSSKARNCSRGKRMLEDFCREQTLPFETCGKVVVAVTEAELPMLARIEERGRENGVACESIGPERLRELEPHAAGVRALHV